MNLKDNYKVGQTVRYDNQPRTGKIEKVYTKSIKLRYNGYTVKYTDCKPDFLKYLIIEK